MIKINSFNTDQFIYTKGISSIANIPKKLWLYGTLPSERRPSVAIVGSRKHTLYGKEVTYQLSFELARRGVIVISGLALGIDAIAHRAALDAGGTTIAVLPTPLQAIHPRTHRQLAEDIVNGGGALLSEYAATDGVFKQNFVARNRIVSALSDGVLITEAALRSGSLTTARFALEQGKSVMVTPGQITSPMSSGCNNLLKVGAAAITEIDDILHELGFTDIKEQARLPLAATKEESILLDLLAAGVRDGELLQQKSGLTAALFSQTLSMLEIEGKIRALGANMWSVRSS